MNSFALWQACEGTLVALWKSAGRRAASTFPAILAGLICTTVLIAGWIWRDVLPISLGDLIGYVAILLIVWIIVRVSNKQMRASLEQTRNSEKILEAERRALEEHMARRTNELVLTEKDRLNELKRTAEFGELSRGLFHDLMNPLSSIALYVEKINQNPIHTPEDEYLVKRAVDVSTRMRSFMETVRDCLGKEYSQEKTANLGQELITVRDVLAYRIRMEDIEFSISRNDSVIVPIHPVRVYQLFLNLISNSIDAFEGFRDTRKMIDVCIERRDGGAMITIFDNGCGIAAEQQSNVFSRPHSTKTKGTGIGLQTVHSIVTNELKGSISLESEHGAFTKFVISIPL